MLIPVWQRLLGILLYLIPWSDALPFGKAMFEHLPPVLFQLLLLPAVPLMILQGVIPFGLGSLLLFLGLVLAVVRNPKIPYFLRFNTLQALVLSILLSVLGFAFFGILGGSLGGSLIFRSLSSTVLIAALAIFIFALVECLRGREPDLPGISQAVRMQLY